ncbi:hypothetical protein Tco_0513744, partial [Tanacetum coccineum]
MPPKRTSTSAAPAMTQDAIRQLVADSVAISLKAQAANLCSSKTDNGTSHVSKKSLCDESLIIPKKEIWLDDKLNYMEESEEIIDREIKQLRRRCIPIVKVRWNSEFTWEREDQICAKYPHLFSNITQSLN